jgi:hypothetical protein
MSSKVESEALGTPRNERPATVDGHSWLDQITEARDVLDALDQRINAAFKTPPPDEAERDQLASLLQAREWAAARLVDATRAAVEFADAGARCERT